MAAINLKMITVNMFVAYDMLIRLWHYDMLICLWPYDMLIHLCPYDMLYSFIKIVLPLWG